MNAQLEAKSKPVDAAPVEVEPKPAKGTPNAFAVKAKDMPIKMVVDAEAFQSTFRRDIMLSLVQQNGQLLFEMDPDGWVSNIAGAADALAARLGETAPANVATCE